MSDNEIDKLLTERDPEGISDRETIRRTAERVRLMAVLLIQGRDQKDIEIDGIKRRLLPLETQLIGWKAQLILLVSQAGLAITLWLKSR